MLRVLQARLRHYMNWNSQMYKLGLEKAEEPEIKLPTSVGSEKKKRNSLEKYLLLLYRLRLSPVWIYKQTVVSITANCGKFLKRWEYQITLPVCWETCIWVKKQQSETYMEQLIGSKLGNEYDKAIYCHPVYLTYMQRILCKCWAGWITAWNQHCQEKYQQPQICRW